MKFGGLGNKTYPFVEILDRNGDTVAKGVSLSGTLHIPSVTPWWPYSMSKDSAGYLYTLKVRYFTEWQSGIMVRGLEFELKNSKFKCTCCHLKSWALITPSCRCMDEYLAIDRGGYIYIYIYIYIYTYMLIVFMS